MSPPSSAQPQGVRHASLRARLCLLAVLAIAVLFVGSAGRFLPHQSLWVDETTQLSGVKLGPRQLVPWLTGRGPDLGVPADRMPPGSYFMQMAWSSIVGFSEAGLRWFGIACTVAGLLFTAMAAARAFGPAAAVAASLFLAVSPNVLNFSVEIRAYPVFLMLSALGSYVLVRALQADGRQRTAWIAALGAVCAAAAYTHFFGVVLAGSLFMALIVDAWRTKKSWTPIIACGAAFGLTCLGLLPFVMSSVRISASTVAEASEAPEPRLIGIARLVYRLFAHPAMARSGVVIVISGVGFAVAALAATLVPRRLDAVRAGLLTALLSGLVAVGCASFVVALFGTTGPHYNIWALPFVALLLSRCVLLPPLGRGIATAAFGCVLIGGLFATIQMQIHRSAYAHGPQNRILALLADLGPAEVGVVYSEDSSAAGHILFPIRYTFGRQLPQYRHEAAAARIVDFDTEVPQPVLSSRERVVVIHAQHVRAAALARRIDDTSQVPERAAAAQLLEKQGWHSISRTRFVGLVTADVEVMGKAQ